MQGSNKKRQVLGRGLSSLIPMDSEEKGSDNEVMFVDIPSIQTNPFQPRLDFDDVEIKGLAESIDKQGLLQPIVLRKHENGYQIISGERRFRALKLLGRDKAPCIVKAKVSDREMLEMALVENIQRENLNEIEEALSYQRLLFECNLSHQELSERVGKSRTTITNTLRLLKLPENIQNLLRDKKMTMGHARALISIDDQEKQATLARRIVEENLTVREVEFFGKNDEQVLVQKETGKKEKTAKERESPAELDPDLKHQQDQLRYRFGTDVAIHLNEISKKGRIEVPFYTMDDLNRILDLLITG